MNNQADSLPAHVHLGITPGGSVWNIFRRPERDSQEAFEQRVAIAQERFAALWAKAEERWGKKVVTVKLGPKARFTVEDHYSLMEGDKDDLQVLSIGVRTTRRVLEDVLARLEDMEEEVIDMTLASMAGGEEHHQDFAERSARKSYKLMIQRLKEATKRPR